MDCRSSKICYERGSIGQWVIPSRAEFLNSDAFPRTRTPELRANLDRRVGIGPASGHGPSVKGKGNSDAFAGAREPGKRVYLGLSRSSWSIVGASSRARDWAATSAAHADLSAAGIFANARRSSRRRCR